MPASRNTCRLRRRNPRHGGAHRAWVIDLLKEKKRSTRAIGKACLIARAIPAELALAEFAREPLLVTREDVAEQVSEPLSPAEHGTSCLLALGFRCIGSYITGMRGLPSNRPVSSNANRNFSHAEADDGLRKIPNMNGAKNSSETGLGVTGRRRPSRPEAYPSEPSPHRRPKFPNGPAGNASQADIEEEGRSKNVHL